MDQSSLTNALSDAQAVMNALFTLGLAALFGLLGYLILFKVLFALTVGQDSPLQTNLLKRCRTPSKIMLPLLAMHMVLPSLGLASGTLHLIRHIGSLLLITMITWLLIASILGIRDLLLEYYDVADGNVKSRAMSTQVIMLVRLSVVIVTSLAGATMLMTFDAVRQVGVSLLASAGVAGIVIGFAAQRSLAALLAGIQIAITQPIRLDDVLFLENEWGWVEEITLTYVVVRIRDLRRLVLPVTYFLETPFQNWSRSSSELMGVVYIYCDYRVPVNILRAELDRIVATTPLWDGKFCRMMVTDASERTVQLRAMISAADAMSVFELRCYVREKLVEFLQREHPESLPRYRTELEGAVLPMQVEEIPT